MGQQSVNVSSKQRPLYLLVESVMNDALHKYLGLGRCLFAAQIAQYQPLIMRKKNEG